METSFSVLWNERKDLHFFYYTEKRFSVCLMNFGSSSYLPSYIWSEGKAYQLQSSELRNYGFTKKSLAKFLVVFSVYFDGISSFSNFYLMMEERLRKIIERKDWDISKIMYTFRERNGYDNFNPINTEIFWRIFF